MFSTFNVRDKQNDVVKRQAFAALDGAEVPLIWGHQWDSLPVGKGVIRVERDRAVFEGAFHLQSEWSREAYATVKAMQGLQEFSYGFDIAEGGAEPGEHDGQPVRVITKIKRVYEVSPVLVGAGEDTRVLAIKSAAEVAAAAVAAVEAAQDDAEPDAAKPYRIERRDDEYCVVNTENRRNMGCHATRAEAEEHRRALYANVEDADKGAAPDAAKAGRRLSAASLARIRAAMEALEALVAEEEAAAADDDSKAAPPPEGAAPGAPTAPALAASLAAYLEAMQVAPDAVVRGVEPELRALADDLQQARGRLERRLAQAALTATVDLEGIKAQLAADAARYEGALAGG